MKESGKSYKITVVIKAITLKTPRGSPRLIAQKRPVLQVGSSLIFGHPSDI